MLFCGPVWANEAVRNPSKPSNLKSYSGQEGSSRRWLVTGEVIAAVRRIVTEALSARREKPDVVRAFLRATARGFQYAAQHPAEAAKYLLAAGADSMDEKLATASQEMVSKV